MNKTKIKKIARSTRNHIYRNRGRYAIAGTAVVLYYAIQKPAVDSWTEFMEERGIDPLEYFCPEAFAEKIA